MTKPPRIPEPRIAPDDEAAFLAPTGRMGIAWDATFGPGLEQATVRWFPPLIRRNPAALAATVPMGELALRVDSATGAVVLSSPGLGLVLDRAACRGLRLSRLAPARGCGAADLDLDYHPPGFPRAARMLDLVSLDRMDGLDAVAPDIARALDLSLVIEEGLDE